MTAISRRSSSNGRAFTPRPKTSTTRRVSSARRRWTRRIHTRGIEVGQVFYFGDKYSKPMHALVTGPDGVERPFQGGSYGVGVSRLVGALDRGQS